MDDTAIIKVIAYSDSVQFYHMLNDNFNKNPPSSSFINGLAYSLCEDPTQYKRKPLLAFVEESKRKHIAVFMTPPWPMVLYTEEEIKDSMITVLIDYFIEKNITVTGINANYFMANIWAERWCKKMQCLKKIKLEMILYSLSHIQPIHTSPGHLQLADESYKPILLEWSKKFNEAMHLDMENTYIENHVHEVIRTKNAFVWIDDDKPVCMVFGERPFEKGIFIGYVYTPPQLRNKGYATNCVSHVSRYYLEHGYEFCSLFTDKANPATNEMYQKIGYQPIENYIYYEFIY